MNDINTQQANPKATPYSFWTLINEANIEIPRLQREYAQGRTDENAAEIRDQLIKAFYKALSENKNRNLNFIYGELKDGENGKKFTPIDGQQRLTALYLLHWYLFLRSENEEGLSKLKKFSYATRDSSKRMCENLCAVKPGEINFAAETISEQIKDVPWFSSNLEMDATVKSMLVVLDEIHKRFKDTDKGQIHIFSDLLMKEPGEDGCPITFLHLNMVNFNKTSDLYIKMNARGKPLTDFEIFKAKLQDSPILKEWMEMTKHENPKAYSDTPEGKKNRIDFISNFNNDYLELFYNKYKEMAGNKAALMADAAIWAFIKTIFRNDYFAELSFEGVGQSKYRDDFMSVYDRSGSAFNNFLTEDHKWEKGDKQIVDKKIINETVGKSLLKINKLLKLFTELFHNDAISITFIDEKDLPYYRSEEDIIIEEENNKDNIKWCDKEILLKDPKDDKQNTMQMEVPRYALYEYINAFGYPDVKNDDEVQAYKMWKRIVYNICNNTDMQRVEAAVESMVIFRALIEIINNQKEDRKPNKGNILKAVAEFNYTKPAAEGEKAEKYLSSDIKYQFGEERIKAINMINDEDTAEIILEAEKYFKDGQIKFLIDSCLEEYSTGYEEVPDSNRKGDAKKFDKKDVLVNYNKLKNIFEISNKLFDENKHVNKKFIKDTSLLERALLSVSIEEDKSYLSRVKNAEFDRKFYLDDFKSFLANRGIKTKYNKEIEGNRNILKNLFEKIEDDKETQGIENKLKKIIEDAMEKEINKTHLWKKYYLEKDLVNKIKIKTDKEEEILGRYLHLDEDSIPLLMLTASTSRSYNTEFYTALLGNLLAKDNPSEVKHHLVKSMNMEQKDDLPWRYFTYKDVKVGFKREPIAEGDHSELPGRFVISYPGMDGNKKFETLEADNLEDAKTELLNKIEELEKEPAPQEVF